MILEIMMWGFFSGGWFGAHYIKEQIWPPEPPPPIEKKIEEKK